MQSSPVVEVARDAVAYMGTFEDSRMMSVIIENVILIYFNFITNSIQGGAVLDMFSRLDTRLVCDRATSRFALSSGLA